MKMENLGFYEYLESSGVGLFYLGMSNLCKNEQIYCPLDFRKEIENLSKIERKADFEEYLWDYVGPKMNFHAVKDKIGIDMDCISEKEKLSL